MSSFGLAGAGSVGIAFETVLGTPVAPTVWVPILDESLEYTEARYFSPQIRQSVVVSDVEQGYYHVQGDINLEIDMNNFPYWMYASRHTAVKSGAGPYNYAFVPSQAGSLTTATGTTAQKSLTITIVRNGVAFHYFGCTVGSIKIDVSTSDGILKATLGIVGMGVADDNVVGTPTWVDALLYGAAAHIVSTGDASITPTYAPVNGYDGFTFTADHQATAENRIIPQRNAAFIKYGETMITIDSTLDFADATDYDDFVATTQRSFELQSFHGANWGAATDGLQIQVFRGVFETYSIPLKGLADIVTAAIQARGIGIASGNAYQLDCLSPVSIT